MTRLLSLFGLMRVSEHEKVKRLSELDKSAMERAFCLRDDWQAKFKQAVADLEKQAVELNEWKTLANDLGAIVEAIKDDAAAMRRKRQMDRDRRKGK